MCHKLTSLQTNIIKKLVNFKEKKEENFLILESPIQDFIYKADLTATSKLLLIYLLSKIDFSYKHLYIHLPYERLYEESNIKKAVAIKSLQDLDKKGFITLYSGKDRTQNTMIKEFLFKKKQFYNFQYSQTNIVDMSSFFAKFFKVEYYTPVSESPLYDIIFTHSHHSSV